MPNFEENFEKLLQEYAAKLTIPNWFVSGIKTLLDRNITIEDWNRVYSYLERMSSDNEVLYKLLICLKENLYHPVANKTFGFVAKIEDFKVGSRFVTTVEYFAIPPGKDNYFYGNALLKPTRDAQYNAFATFKAFVTEIIDDYEIAFELVDVDIIYDSKKVVSVDKEQTITATKYFNDESGYEIEINPNECQVLLTDEYDSYNRITPHNISMKYEGGEEMYLTAEEQLLQFRNSYCATEYSNYHIYHRETENGNVKKNAMLEFPSESGTIATEEYVDKKVANLDNYLLKTGGEINGPLDVNDSVDVAGEIRVGELATFYSGVDLENAGLRIRADNHEILAEIIGSNAYIKIDDEKVATEEYVDKKIANLVNSAPETLDTLGEVAQALQENDNVVDALNSAIGNKVDKTYVDEKLGDIQTLLEAI